MTRSTSRRVFMILCWAVVSAARADRAMAADCNQNGIEDAVDIATLASLDCDVNGVPDECQPDSDGDGTPDACDGCGVQITDNNKAERWGSRQPSTSRGRVIWADEDESIHFFDGVSASLLQAKDVNVPSLDNVETFVFTLGSGAGADDVVGGWRRGTDFAWVWAGAGSQPQLVSAVNPYDPNSAMNPEGIAAADGCVFLLLQAAVGGTLIKHVFQVDPASGSATLLTGGFLNDVNNDGTGAYSTAFYSDGCRAAWLWCSAGANGSCNDDAVQLHCFDGASVQVIDSNAVLYGMNAGRVVYSKDVGGVPQLFVYDTNLPNPAPVQITQLSSTDPRIIFAQTDGWHVAMLLGDSNFQNREVALLGGFALSDVNTQPADQPLNFNFPIQLQRGQALWQTRSGSIALFDGWNFGTVCNDGWLADGRVAQLRRSSGSGADVEVFLKDAVTAAAEDVPAAPWIVSAQATANGVVELAWEAILGATSYNVYYAPQSGANQSNFQALGGAAMTGVPSNGTTISGIPGNVPIYFVVSTVVSGAEGPVSREATANPCVDPAADADSDGTPDCMEVPDAMPGNNPPGSSAPIGGVDTGLTGCGAGMCGVGSPLMLTISLVGLFGMRPRAARALKRQQ